MSMRCFTLWATHSPAVWKVTASVFHCRHVEPVPGEERTSPIRLGISRGPVLVT